MKKRFIFDENYIKRYAKKDKTKWLIIGVSALVLIIIIIIVILATSGKRRTPKDPIVPVFEFKDELVVEAGSVLPEPADYFKKLENINIDDITIEYPEDFEIGYDMSSCSAEETEKINESNDPDLSKYKCAIPILKTTNTYGVTIGIQDEEYTVVLKVQDTMAPVLISKDLRIYEGEEYELNDFVQLCYDASSECEISYYDKDQDSNGNIIDYGSFKKAGSYTVKLVARDYHNNKTEPIEANLIIDQAEAELFTVTFDTQGGSAISDVVVQDGGNIMVPSNPIKDGYYFTGWTLNGAAFDFKTEITSDITLVAKWEAIPVQEPDPKPPVVVDPKPPQIVYVNSIYLDYKTINLYTGDSKTVVAVVNPTNAVDRNVTWTTSDASIATVNGGVITGGKAGTATITATAGSKSASVTVVVREKSGGGVTPGTCQYGDTTYNGSYILSANLSSNGCAVNPNGTYNESVSSRDYQNIIQTLLGMGYNTSTNYFNYSAEYYKIKNNAGTGLVGYQITVTVSIQSPDNPYTTQTGVYIIKPDGSRQFIKNLVVNGTTVK